MTQKQQRHKDTRTLPNSNTHHLCDATGDTQHTARGIAHAKVPEVPSKCEQGESSSSGVAQSALDRCQRWRARRARARRARAPASGPGTGSISRPKSDGGRSCSIQQQLRLFRMDSMDVDCHPCASKQEQIVKFACGEQGLGRAGERPSAPKGAAGERVEVGFEGGSQPSGER